MFPKIMRIKNENGTAIIVALSFLTVLAIMTSAFLSNLMSSSNFQSSLETGTRGFYIAEAGLNHAMWKLGQLGNGYTGESDVRFAQGRFDILVEDDPGDAQRKIIISHARLDGYPERKPISKLRATVALKKMEGGELEVILERWERVN